MNILQYDLTNYDVDAIVDVVRYMNSKGLEIIAVPKDFDLLINCDTYTLHYLKNKIEDAIQKKEIINNI